MSTTVVPSCYEYPYDPKVTLSRSISEHHYDEPQHSMNSGARSSLRPSTVSPSASTLSRGSCASEHSISSSYPSTESTYNVALGSVRLPQLENSGLMRIQVGSRGAVLALPNFGLSMTIPEGALSKSGRTDFFIKVLEEDRYLKSSLRGKD